MALRFVTLRIGLALLARVLFLGHSLLAVGHTANMLGNPMWWLLALANVALVVETIYTVVKRNGEELRWICPSAVCYLLATVPAICLLELDQLSRRFSTVQNVSCQNHSAYSENDMTFDPSSPIPYLQDLLPVRLSADMWVEVIEQMLLLLLIIGRWLMPKGELSRDELSQLLFVYIAIASDIMELFVLFEEDRVYQNEALRYSILGVWGFSLFQFTLVLTASRNPKKARPVASGGDVSLSDHDGNRSPVVCCRAPYVEILSLLSSLCIMDGPFLAIRLFVLISLELMTYNILFFTCKNLLMVSLLFYRFLVIINDIRKRKHKNDEEISIGAVKELVDPDDGNSNSQADIIDEKEGEPDSSIHVTSDIRTNRLSAESRESCNSTNRLSAESRESCNSMGPEEEKANLEKTPGNNATESAKEHPDSNDDGNFVSQTQDHALRLCRPNSIPECDQKADTMREIGRKGEMVNFEEEVDLFRGSQDKLTTL